MLRRPPRLVSARRGDASRPSMRLACVLALVATLAASLAACGDDVRSGAVYIEDIPSSGLAADRTHAVRVTVFEFGDRIGGFIEYFALDDEANTRTDPWFRPSSCAWFGDGPIRDGDFVIDAAGVQNDDRLVLRASWDGRRRASFATVWVTPGGVTSDLADFDAPEAFVRDDSVLPSRNCEAPLVDGNP